MCTLTNRFAYAAFIVLIFLFYHLYLYVEMIPIAYLTSFSVKYLNFSIQDASLVLSVFFGSHFTGRMLGIPLSVVLRPRTMVIVNLTATALANMLLLAFVNVWPAIVWPSAALAGLSMATTFATAALWIADRVPLTGRLASVLVGGSALGGVFGPLFVGRMFESSTPMWFVYSTVAASVGHVLLFGVMVAFVGRCDNRLKRMTAFDRREVVRMTSSSEGGANRAVPLEKSSNPVSWNGTTVGVGSFDVKVTAAVNNGFSSEQL
jgi:fucose permease